MSEAVTLIMGQSWSWGSQIAVSRPNILDNLNFENDNIPDIINLEELKINNSVIKPIHHAVVYGRKPLIQKQLSLKKKKQQQQKTKVILNYWNKLKLNWNGILVKIDVNNEHLLLPKKYHCLILKELHENMGHLGFDKVVELVKQRFYWWNYENNLKTFIKKYCQCLKNKKPNQTKKHH